MEFYIGIACFISTVISLAVLIVFFRTAGRIRDILDIMQKYDGQPTGVPTNLSTTPPPQTVPTTPNEQWDKSSMIILAAVIIILVGGLIIFNLR